MAMCGLVALCRLSTDLLAKVLVKSFEYVAKVSCEGMPLKG